MVAVWFRPELSDEIINNSDVIKHTHIVVTDILSGRIDITRIVENMAGVLTHKEAENREKGMIFFTKLLKEIPNNFLTETQVKFISKFYTDRLKDHHKVIPAVLEGYLSIIAMKNYSMQNSAEFFTTLFREVACQSQLRQERYNIYIIIQMLLERDLEYMKSLGPDFIYGFISSMDGERDPRNLLFLFDFVPKFISSINLGHLVEEMFDVISCYYPIDFHPSPDDPAAVTRQDLAIALAPCLCAVPEFGEQCLVLLIEKLDSNLRLAKIDSLNLLKESCKTFNAESYGPFMKTLWSSIHREITHKTDDELKMAAHGALSSLVAKLATTVNTDQAFENFIKGIIIAMQSSIAESTTVSQFVSATRVLLTAANASKESCLIITKSMVPAIITYYGFNTSPKLQMASLEFLGDLYLMAKHWSVLDDVAVQVAEIPQICLTAVSERSKYYQIAGFKTLIVVKDILKSDLVLPFVEVLIHNVQHSQDNDLLTVCIETIHTIGRVYPELIMSLVVKGKCNLENLSKDKSELSKRLSLLSNLASIDDFTKVIVEEMLKLISDDQDAPKVVEALSDSISNTSVYTNEKVAQIDSDHGLVDSILTWLFKEIENNSHDLSHGYNLVANTISSLPAEKQRTILSKHTSTIMEKCKINEIYFMILECVYSSLHQNIYMSTFEEIMTMALSISLTNNSEVVRMKACILIAHFLNKAEYGQKFELLYELLKKYLSACSREDQAICPKLINLYSWITKALLMRGSDSFLFWLQKIMVTISSPEYCRQGADAIRLIMTDSSEYLNAKQHCRISLLYKQRMFQSFSKLCENFEVNTVNKESYLLSWAYVLEKAPKTVLNNEIIKIAPLVVDSLEYDDKDLLLVMVDVLCHFVQAKEPVICDSLQTILPRLINLSKYVKAMDVRIKSLQCLFDIANNYPTAPLLPYKQDLLIDLTPSLDDKKRLVRNMAVRARTRWFLIGAPGEAKEN